MNRLELLDYARFFATLMVMAFHYTFNGIANGKIQSITHVDKIVAFTKYGYLGVELFFMISGYVIIKSAMYGSASKFAISRAIRIYPSYWFAVLFTSSIAYIYSIEGPMSITIDKTLINLTMLQQWLGYGNVDGVYWTLAYELMFYFAVLALLIVGLQKWLFQIFLSWPYVMWLALYLEYDYLPYLGGYFVYFSAGTIFMMRNKKPNLLNTISLFLCIFLCIHFSISKADILSLAKNTVYSPLVIAIIVALFFMLFEIINMPKLSKIRLPVSKHVGALTYPIYLIHAHFGYILLDRYANDNNKLIVYSAVVLLVLVISWLMHAVIEQRLRWLWALMFHKTIGMVFGYTKRLIDVLR